VTTEERRKVTAVVGTRSCFNNVPGDHREWPATSVLPARAGVAKNVWAGPLGDGVGGSGRGQAARDQVHRIGCPGGRHTVGIEDRKTVQVVHGSQVRKLQTFAAVRRCTRLVDEHGWAGQARWGPRPVRTRTSTGRARRTSVSWRPGPPGAGSANSVFAGAPPATSVGPGVGRKLLAGRGLSLSAERRGGQKRR